MAQSRMRDDRDPHRPRARGSGGAATGRARAGAGGRTPAGADTSAQRAAAPPQVSARSAALAALGVIAAALVVAGAVLAVHWPVLRAQALYLDDDVYVTKNVAVQHPSWASAERFLREVLAPSTVKGYYQPLAMISLMLDWAAGGRPDDLRVFHVTSLALHVLNTMLVLLLVYRLFGNTVIAAGVALLFGLHPFTVESVAWVSDRKTLLSTCFALATLVIYVGYARRPRWFVLTACAATYLLALLAKPTATPLPVLMLLLDVWPLRRWDRQHGWRVAGRLLLEKLPLLALAAVSSVVTVISQARTATIISGDAYPASFGVMVSCHNIVFYLNKLLVPINLSSYYAPPLPFGISQPAVLVGIIGTIVLIAGLLLATRWTVAPLIGWLFLFAALLPASGVVQFTNVIASHKFAYLPMVGLLLPLAALLGWLWHRPEAISQRRLMRAGVVVVVAAWAGMLAMQTRVTQEPWQDTRSLFLALIAQNPNVASLHFDLGLHYLDQTQLEDAERELRAALRCNPNHAKAAGALGDALNRTARPQEALPVLLRAAQLAPRDAQIAKILSSTYKALAELAPTPAERTQAFADSEHAARRATQLAPNDSDAFSNLGNALGGQGKFGAALEQYDRALQLNPHSALGLMNRAATLAMMHRLPEAIAATREALKLEPDNPDMWYNLGVMLSEQGNRDEAIEALNYARGFDPHSVRILNALQRLDASAPPAPPAIYP